MGKWIEISDVKQPAAQAAAEILENRMLTVQHFLLLAAFEYKSDVEHVHQLRVGCRRTAAALKAFRPLLLEESKPLRKWVRKIRRAAGPARDIDVMIDRQKSLSKSRGIAKYILARLKQQRKDVQPQLIKVAKKATSGRLSDSTDRCLLALLKSAAKKKAMRFNTFARTAMQTANQAMFQLAEINQPTVSQLHELRIAGKRLRYSIELFHDAFDPDLRDVVYPIVEKIQSRLGQLNDHATAQSLFQCWLTDLPPDKRAAQLATRVVKEYEKTEQEREEFLQWWTKKRIAALKSQLTAMIQ